MPWTSLHKPDMTKPGLTRHLAKPILGKPLKRFRMCNPVKTETWACNSQWNFVLDE